MDVVLAPGVSPDVPKMLQVIKAAGYTPVPEDVRLTARGVIAVRDGLPVLELDAMKRPMRLALTASANAPQEVARLIEQHKDQPVTVEGLWKPAAAGDKTDGVLQVMAAADPSSAGANAGKPR